MKKAIATFAALAILGVLAPSIYADAFIIDHFTEPATGQTLSVTGSGSASNTEIGLAGVVGGSRTLLITTVGQFDNISSLTLDVSGTGSLSMNNGSGQDGTGKIVWDANGAGLGGVDLTVGGTLPYLQARILASDLDLGFSVLITETAAAGGSTAIWTTSLGEGVSFVNQALSSFTNAANVDFTLVDKIVLMLSGPSAQDTTLDLLEITNTPAVPEPVTMALLGLGGLGLLIRRRRHA